MRITIPSEHVTKVASHGYVQVYKRARNQNGIYLLTFKGETLHMGKRRHIAKMFNYYRGTTGRPMEKAVNGSWYSDAVS